MLPSIGHLPQYAAEKFGGAPGFLFDDGYALTFSALDARAARIAGGLSARGIARGDRVILYLPNSADWIAVYYAIARLRAVIVPANVLLTSAEIAYMAQDSGAKAIILPEDKRQGLQVDGMLIVTPDGGRGTVSIDALASAPPLAPAEGDANDLLTVGYTSGTTGQPKGAMLTHGNIFASVSGTATIHVRTNHDLIYTALPLPHVYGNVIMHTCLLTGARSYQAPRFDAGEALKAIGEKRVTLFEGVPTMYYQMLAHPDIGAADLSSLTRCTVGGQTMPLAKLEAVVERFGCPLLELWGMTELGGPATAHSPYWAPRLGSIGLPFPGMEARIASLDDPTKDAPPNEAGELLARGALVMKGYWNKPEATANTIDGEGWLATGDIAIRDRDGHIFIVDRKKDMILTGGYNVYPAELEAVLAAHPSVSMAAVSSAPDEKLGEIAIAHVVLHTNADLTEAALLAHCRASLAAYKIPRVIKLVDDLPRTSTGKILRRALKQDPPANRLTDIGS